MAYLELEGFELVLLSAEEVADFVEAVAIGKHDLESICSWMLERFTW